MIPLERIYMFININCVFHIVVASDADHITSDKLCRHLGEIVLD